MLSQFSEISKLVGLAKDLGLFKYLKRKLIKQYDPAIEELSVVLGEIYKIYDLIDTEINIYLTMRFRPENLDFIREDEQHLSSWQGKKIVAKVAQSRGHCSRIMKIYHDYLKTWFPTVLNSEECKLVDDVFWKLDEFDGIMVKSTKELAEWLSSNAGTVLIHLKADNFAGANNKIKEDSIEILPIREAIAEAMATLSDLQADFIKIASS
jgi:hypothetical protein